MIFQAKVLKKCTTSYSSCLLQWEDLWSFIIAKVVNNFFWTVCQTEGAIWTCHLGSLEVWCMFSKCLDIHMCKKQPSPQDKMLAVNIIYVKHSRLCMSKAACHVRCITLHSNYMKCNRDVSQHVYASKTGTVYWMKRLSFPNAHKVIFVPKPY